MDIGQWFQIAAASTGIAGIISGAAVYSRSRFSFELLRGDLNDSRARETDLRQEIADLRTLKARIEGESEQLKQRVGMLEDLVTRVPDIAELAGRVEALHKTVAMDYANFAPALHRLVEEKRAGDQR